MTPTDARIAPRGKGSNPRISPAKALAIREVFALGGYSQRDLSVRYNVSEYAVREILTGRTHRDAGGPIVSEADLARVGDEIRRASTRGWNQKPCGACGAAGDSWHATALCPNPRRR